MDLSGANRVKPISSPPPLPESPAQQKGAKRGGAARWQRAHCTDQQDSHARGPGTLPAAGSLGSSWRRRSLTEPRGSRNDAGQRPRRPRWAGGRRQDRGGNYFPALVAANREQKTTRPALRQPGRGGLERAQRRNHEDAKTLASPWGKVEGTELFGGG